MRSFLFTMLAAHALALALAACGDDSGATTPPDAAMDVGTEMDAGSDGGGADGEAEAAADAAGDVRRPRPDAEVDAGPPTDVPDKGPWVLRVDTTSAVVRWETRLAPDPVSVEVEPAAGGGPVTTATGTARETEVRDGYGVGS